MTKGEQGGIDLAKRKLRRARIRLERSAERSARLGIKPASKCPSADYSARISQRDADAVRFAEAMQLVFALEMMAGRRAKRCPA